MKLLNEYVQFLHLLSHITFQKCTPKSTERMLHYKIEKSLLFITLKISMFRKHRLYTTRYINRNELRIRNSYYFHLMYICLVCPSKL